MPGFEMRRVENRLDPGMADVHWVQTGVDTGWVELKQGRLLRDQSTVKIGHPLTSQQVEFLTSVRRAGGSAAVILGVHSNKSWLTQFVFLKRFSYLEDVDRVKLGELHVWCDWHTRPGDSGLALAARRLR